MYFPHQKLKATETLKGLTCILFEKIIINPKVFITILGIERATMGIWNK